VVLAPAVDVAQGGPQHRIVGRGPGGGGQVLQRRVQVAALAGHEAEDLQRLRMPGPLQQNLPRQVCRLIQAAGLEMADGGMHDLL